ncbi:hypothetical protein [Rhodopila sp.]|uniref:hypothetical protein n=1 Tax=Rhodopila sp. TaxID=2480087 RepID=UPI003D1191E5
MKITDDAIIQGMQKARAALDDRTRLVAFGRDLTARLAAAEVAEAAATAAQGEADAKAILAPPAERDSWAQRADAEAMKVATARRERDRLTAAQGSFPALLQTADEAIMAAHTMLAAASAPVLELARQDLQAELRETAEQLGRIKLRGYALAAAGVPLGSVLDQIQIPSATGGPWLIRGATMQLGDDAVALNTAWRAVPEALALFEAHIELAALQSQIGRDVSRIEADRQQTLRAVNRAARSRSFDNPPPQHVGPRTEYVAPKSTFVPKVTNQPPAVARDATVPLDVLGEDPVAMTRGETDALHDQAAGAGARPTPPAAPQGDTPEVAALSRHMPVRMARRQVENEAHLKRLATGQAPAAGEPVVAADVDAA